MSGATQQAIPKSGRLYNTSARIHQREDNLSGGLLPKPEPLG
jgi:hypothetical protein